MSFEALLAWKGAIVVLWFAVFFAAERLRPAAPSVKGKDRLIRNGGLWATNLILSPLIILPLTLWAAGAGPDWRPDFGGAVGMVLIDLLILDLWIYWQHRAFHVAPFLWRFHAPHHFDETLDATSAVRFHFGEVLISAAFRAVVVFTFDISWTSVVVFESLVLMAAIFHHSNVDLPPRLERALSFVIVTPSIHWVHHHAVRRDTDSNYANIFSVWDRLFGSRSATSRTPDMPIGVEGGRDVPLLQLFLSPFKTSGR